MKTLILAASLLASLPVFSAQYSCVAGKIETINFNMNVEDDQVTLKFSKATNPEIATDLNRKSAVLDLEADRTADAHGWQIYYGNKLVNKLMNDYRHFELKIDPVTPNGSNTLDGAFALSPRGTSLWPSYYSEYDLNCKKLTK